MSAAPAIGGILAVMFLGFVLEQFGRELHRARSENRLVVSQTKAVASYYGPGYVGHIMANGQPFDPAAMTCASWDWPLGTVLYVENAADPNKGVLVTVTDRGPSKTLHRTIDLSEAAFKKIASTYLGVIGVEIELVTLGKGKK